MYTTALHATASTSGDETSGYLDPEKRISRREVARLTDDSWAEVASQALHATAGPSLDPTQLAQIGLEWALRLTAAAEYRHSNKLDEARRKADQMLALARLLVARFPNEPAAHLALGETYMQFSKNAWQIHDRAAIERNLRLAIDATQHALNLDPKHALARVLMEQRQQRLKNLLEPKRAPITPNQTVHSASLAGS